MARYSARDGRWYGVRNERPSGPDPYGPDAPAYASRNRLTETALPSGTLRVDVGEPVSRLPSEGLRVKAAPLTTPPAISTRNCVKIGSPEPLPSPEEPVVISMPAAPRTRRAPWGINRDDA